MELVNAIAEMAQSQGVPLVRRFEAMQYLAQSAPNRSHLARDQFHPNDLGYHCMAEHVGQAIILSILSAEPGSSAPEKHP